MMRREAVQQYISKDSELPRKTVRGSERRLDTTIDKVFRLTVLYKIDYTFLDEPDHSWPQVRGRRNGESDEGADRGRVPQETVI